KWLFGTMKSTDNPAEILPFLNVSQSLLRVLPADIRVPAGVIGPVSDAYRLHTDNWIRLEALVDQDSYTELDKVLPQASTVIQNHEKFLVATLQRLDSGAGVGGNPGESPPEQGVAGPVPGPPPSAEQLQRLHDLIVDRRRGLRRQARELLRAGSGQREWERFGTLLQEGNNLAAPLCTDRAGSFAADCSDLDTALAEIGGGYAQFAESELRQGPGEGDAPRTYWADSNGFALGGLDPVTCFDKIGILARTANQARPGAAAAPSGEANTSAACTLRKGRLGYSYVWNGRIWLFESEQNRRLFRESFETYAPRLGGYDIRAVQRLAKEKQNDGNVRGMTIGGRLYLTSQFMSPTEVKPEDIAQAERNWALIKSAPETVAAADMPLDSVQPIMDDASAMEPAADPPAQEPPATPPPDAVPDDAAPREDAKPEDGM
ncbi:MAG TPA: hypothetical protein VK633_10025, partial [Verrucomicrobiae bacterium]|nr:hypothetical protein [Verrucomicrobiae bacterium]